MATPKSPKAPLLRRISKPATNLWRFLRDVYSELQRVVWPSHEETYSFTVVIILAIAIVAVWVGILDIFFTTLMTFLGISK